MGWRIRTGSGKRSTRAAVSRDLSAVGSPELAPHSRAWAPAEGRGLPCGRTVARSSPAAPFAASSWRYGSGLRPITSPKTKAGVKGRWHDNRHTLVTELAESGAGDEVTMSIAGHVSRAMLSRYSHVRMEAKRRALDEIAARQRAADEKREEESERRERVAIAPESAVIQ